MKNNIGLFRYQKDRISQAKLAELTGVSRQSINAIETGRFNPSVELAMKIAAVLECRVEDLFILEDEK